MNRGSRIAILSVLTAAMLLATFDQALNFDEEFGQSDKLHQSEHD
jgi:hypothetical protein